MIRFFKNKYHLLRAILVNILYGFPSKKLTIIGVTGTDGKTTTTNLIYHILNENKYPVAMVSTVSAKIGREDIDTGFHVTSPDTFLLTKLLKKMVDNHMKYAIVEATSHALHQNRFFPLHFHIGVLTNITHEHLDYHKTYEQYVAAKSILFQNSDIAILNKDDFSFEKIKKYIPSEVKQISYSLKNNETYHWPLPGEYNKQNVLAAASVCLELGLTKKQIDDALKTFLGVIGRMQYIDCGQPFSAIVDFAHTPNALEKLLSTLKKNAKGKVIVVFGSAGLRDHTKRPKMGKAASDYTDFAFLTSEDPRTEDPQVIAQEIAEGFSNKNKYEIETDRQKAIDKAIAMAKKEDIVVVTGKGHETSLCFGTTEYPWSDTEAVEKALTKNGFAKNKKEA